MGEPGGLQSMGLRRVGHDWVTSLSLFTFLHWRRKWQPTPVFLPGESKTRLKRLSILSFLFSTAEPGLVQFCRSVMSDSLRPHGLQHTRLPCLSPTSSACSNLRPSSPWCHPTTPSSVIPFSSCLQSFLASGSFPKSQFFTSGGQSIGASASASVLPMNIQDWFPLELAGLISLQSRDAQESSPTPQFKSLYSLVLIFL